MIAALRAMIWLRLRLLRNELRSAKSRDWLEKLSRIGAVLTPILMALFLIPTALGLVVGAGVVAYFSATQGNPMPLTVALRILLLLMIGLLLFAPVFRSIQGSRISVDRLRLLPFSREVLHLSEFFAGLADPWLAVVAAALMAVPVGLAAAGAFGGAITALFAGLAMIGFLLGLSSLSSWGAVLIFRKRRLAEMLTLVLILVLSSIGLLPILMDAGDSGRARLEAKSEEGLSEEEMDQYVERERLERERVLKVVRAFGWLPSELYGHSVASSLRGEGTDAALRTMGVGFFALLLYLLSSLLHRRALEGVASGGGRRGQGTLKPPRMTFPFSSAGTGALARVAISTTLSTVRGKLAVYFTFFIVGLLYVTVWRGALQLELDQVAVPLGPGLLLIGILLTQLSLQPVMANMFAVDGAGLTLTTLAPLSDRELVLGKQAGCMGLSAISWGLCFLAAVLIAPSGDLAAWLVALLTGIASALVALPVCSAISAIFPKTADLTKMGKAGNPHATAGIVSFLVTGISFLLPMMIAVGVWLVSRSSLMVLLALIVWTGIAALCYRPVSGLSAELVGGRRENLLLVAGGR